MSGQPTRASATESSCTGAELPGPAAPERSRCAINLTSLATFPAKVFVRSVDHTAARKQDAFGGSGGAVNIDNVS